MSDFRWTVVLPKNTKGVIGQKRPQATLVYGERGEQMAAALSVGRKLLSESKSGFCPQSARELLDHVLELERAEAWNTLLAHLNRRDLTTQEAQRWLERAGFSAQTQKESVAHARELRFIDDVRYAHTFADQKSALGWGRRKICQELARRGVDVDEIDGFLEIHFDDEDELNRARGVVAKKAFPSKNAYEKLVRFLMGKGFGFDVAKRVANERLHGECEF